MININLLVMTGQCTEVTPNKKYTMRRVLVQHKYRVMLQPRHTKDDEYGSDDKDLCPEYYRVPSKLKYWWGSRNILFPMTEYAFSHSHTQETHNVEFIFPLRHPLPI